MNAKSILTILTCSLLLAACSKHPPLALVTDEEASQPASRDGFARQDKGPHITVLAPNILEMVTSPFPIHIEFSEGSDATAVNMASLKLTYKRLWGIDITDRVKDYVSGTTIAVPETEMPAGKHTIEIYIEDSVKNISTRQITVTIQADS